MSKVEKLIEESPDYLKKSLEAMGENLALLFKETFTYPAPSFPPVFGEIPVTMLSPFGKVRYPIVFEWMPYKGVEEYEISIEDTDWYIKTTNTKIEVNRKDLELTPGEEYIWQFRVIENGEAAEEINGFFSLPTTKKLTEVEQIESKIKEIEPKVDRLTLWGGILEERELYIEAIQNYKRVYDMEPSPGIAYRIAYCYDRLELEELRDEWNRKIV